MCPSATQDTDRRTMAAPAAHRVADIFQAASNYFAGMKGDYFVPVRASPGNLNTSLARSSVTRRTISFAFSASTPVSLDTYANCVGAANRVPEARTISAI